MKLNKTFGRVATTLVATAMMASLAVVPASAENVGVSFNKTIDMTNASGATVPDISYDYTVEAGEAVGADPVKNTPEIKAGITYTQSNGDGTTKVFPFVESAEFDPEDEIPENKQVTKTVSVDFTGVEFTQPGIYRYKVTEYPDTQLADMEFNANNDFTYILDVYVAYNDNDELEVTGAVWTRDAVTPTLNGDKAVYGDGTTDDEISAKISGDVDAYTTYTLTIEKQVEGDMADAGRDYKFDVALSGLTEGEKVAVGTLDAMTSGADESGNLNISNSISLKPTESITIYGLPSTVTYKVIENLAVSEGYTVTAKVNGSDNVRMSANQDKSAYESNSVSLKSNTDDEEISDKIVVTNTKEAVTPTGIVMNVAPYALLVVIAVAGCFVFLRKRRED